MHLARVVGFSFINYNLPPCFSLLVWTQSYHFGAGENPLQRNFKNSWLTALWVLPVEVFKPITEPQQPFFPSFFPGCINPPSFTCSTYFKACFCVHTLFLFIGVVTWGPVTSNLFRPVLVILTCSWSVQSAGLFQAGAWTRLQTLEHHCCYADGPGTRLLA